MTFFVTENCRPNVDKDVRFMVKVCRTQMGRGGKEPTPPQLGGDAPRLSVFFCFLMFF